MIENYSGWMTKEIVSDTGLYAELQKQEAFALNFIGSSKHYKNGEVLVGDVRYGADLIGSWSRSFEYPYVALNLPKDKKLSILDIGSGYGYFPYYVSTFGHTVTCSDVVDLSSFYKDKSVNFVLDDITKTAITEQYDVIYCISVLEHIPDREAAIINMCKLLKKGGKLILTLDCDLIGGNDSNTPNYGSLSGLICKLNKKFDKNIYEFNLARNDIITTLDYVEKKWQLPWRFNNNYKGKYFKNERSLFNILLRKEKLPCIGVFVGTWNKIHD